jgi:cysteinyl-tRNA synthetase
MTPLRLYNTLTRRKEIFEPLHPERVRVYSCGPTVYSRQHVGNLRAFLFADLLNRTLRYAGYDVYHVINVTDVGHLTDDENAGEDKVELAARESGLSAWDVAQKWTRILQADLAKLHVRIPDLWCKATDHIPEQIEMIRTLEAKGYTYRTDDGIYFDTSLVPNYGELARLRTEAQQTQERIAAAGQKRHSADFALWKLSPRGGSRRQMEWQSPWGVGFPGWHIECSAMSSKYLGVPFDIHTGGVDHIPVHHTNEIAQSEAAFDVRPWVRFWLHEEFFVSGGEKISKSKGGSAFNLDELAQHGIEPLALRYFFLQAHYRQNQSVGDEGLRGAQNAYQRLLRHAVLARDATESRHAAHAAAYRARFREAIFDDLGAPQALAVVWELVRSEELGGGETWALLEEFDAVLGLGLAEAKPAAAERDERVEALLREREAARRARDFARADRIRDRLRTEGILVEDGPQGTRWRRG